MAVPVSDRSESLTGPPARVRPRPRAARDRAAARGGVPALRLRLPRRTRTRRSAAGCGSGSRPRGCARSPSCRRGCCTIRRRWSGCCSTSRSTSRRCSAIPSFYLAFREQRRAAAAHLSVHPHLARGLFDGRGGLLDGDPPRGGGAVRPRAHLRHRHQRRRAAAARGRDLPARPDAGVHRELHPGGRQALVLRVLHGEVRRRAVQLRRSRGTSCSRSTTSSPTGRSASSTSSSAATC